MKNMKLFLLVLAVAAVFLCGGARAFDLKYQKTCLEIAVGDGYTAMDEWNKGFANSAQALYSAGEYLDGPYYYEYADAPFFSLDAGNMYDTGAGLLDISLKYFYISLSEPDMKFTWSNFQTSNSIKTLIRPSFFGVSLKYGLELNKPNFPYFDLFAGFDLGAFTTYGRQTTYSYYGNGALMGIYSRDFDTGASFFPGGSAELTSYTWFTDRLGIAIKGGYRLANGFVNYKVTKDPDQANVGGKGHINVDYSGFYFNAGIVLAVWQ
jgi:hypothetical protein